MLHLTTWTSAKAKPAHAEANLKRRNALIRFLAADYLEPVEATNLNKIWAEW